MNESELLPSQVAPGESSEIKLEIRFEHDPTRATPGRMFTSATFIENKVSRTIEGTGGHTVRKAEGADGILLSDGKDGTLHLVPQGSERIKGTYYSGPEGKAPEYAGTIELNR